MNKRKVLLTMKSKKTLFISLSLLLLAGCSNPFSQNASNDPSTSNPADYINNSGTEDNASGDNIQKVDYQWVVEEYNRAKELERNKKYIDAYKTFESIKKYIDIEDVIYECSYYTGLYYLDEYDFDKAKECFLASNDYGDSKEYLSYLDVYEELGSKYEAYDENFKFNDMIHLAIPIEEAEPTVSDFYGEWVNATNSKDKIVISEKYFNEKEYHVLNCVSLNGIPLNYIYLYSEDKDDITCLSYNKELDVVQKNGVIYNHNKKVSPKYEISGEYNKTTSSDGMDIAVFKHGVYNVYEMSINGLNDSSKTELEVPSRVGPFKVTALRDTAFESCNKITKITLPETLISIGKHCISSCDRLTEIKLPESLERIGDESFVDLPITKITIPASVTSIGADVLTNNTKLEKIKVEKENTVFVSSDGVLYNKDKTRLLVYPAGKQDTDFELPKTVTSIASNAFYNNKYIKNITFPAGLKSLDDSTLRGCTSLKTLTFLGNTQMIDNELFKGTSALTFEAPYNAESIENYCKTKKFKVNLAEKPKDEKKEAKEDTKDNDEKKSDDATEDDTEESRDTKEE